MVITQYKSSPKPITKDDDDGEDFDKDEDDDDVGNGIENNNIRTEYKPLDQVREERLRDLQAEIAFHHRMGQYDEALKVSQKLLENSVQHFGEQHPVTASAFNNAALMHKYLGNFEESRDMYHRALRVYGEIVGKDHASYAAALNNLANLFRAQSQIDEKLTKMERLQLNEAAIEYFEEALEIRKVELGKDHPHTVTSHTNLGAAMASLLLQEQANRGEQYKRDQYIKNKTDTTSNNNNNNNKNKKGNKFKKKKTSDSDNNNNNTTTTITSPLQMTKFTKSRWNAAEQHLRTALNTAVQTPRGKVVIEPTTTTLSVSTLSAANAAQNLAVFLKTKADLAASQQLVLGDGANTEDMYAEAHRLYQGALEVRTKGLSESHPDTVATKFSLAELYESAFSNEDEANRLRQEILNAYNVEERDEPHDANHP